MPCLRHQRQAPASTAAPAPPLAQARGLYADKTQVRRASCWNDRSLRKFHKRGLERLGGQAKVRELIGGPWAIRYSLTHLVKDESSLSAADWQRTWRVVQHGSAAAGFL